MISSFFTRQIPPPPPVLAEKRVPPSTGDVEIKKIALAFFGALCLSGVFYLLTACPPALCLAAIPFTTAGGSLLWDITKTRDYSHQTRIAHYQKEAKSMTLDQIEGAHTLAKMFHFEIPAKQDFDKIYRTSMRGKTFNQIMSTYERYLKGPFTPPPPKEFIEVFKQEIKGVPAAEFLRRYAIEDLKKHGIITNDFYKRALRHFELKKIHSNGMTDSEKRLQSELIRALDAFIAVIHSTTGNRPVRQAWIEKLKRESARLIEIPASRWEESSLDILKVPLLPPGKAAAPSMRGLHNAHLKFLEVRQQETTKFNRYKEQIDQALQVQIDGFNIRFSSYDAICA